MAHSQHTYLPPPQMQYNGGGAPPPNHTEWAQGGQTRPTNRYQEPRNYRMHDDTKIASYGVRNGEGNDGYADDRSYPQAVQQRYAMPQGSTNYYEQPYHNDQYRQMQGYPPQNGYPVQNRQVYGGQSYDTVSQQHPAQHQHQSNTRKQRPPQMDLQEKSKRKSCVVRICPVCLYLPVKERILTEPVSPETVAWDNPFPVFNPKKKKNNHSKSASLDKGMAHLDLNHKSTESSRPQTSQSHRNEFIKQGAMNAQAWDKHCKQ